MKKTKQTRQSTSKSSSTGRVISRTAQKNAQKARDNAKKNTAHKSGEQKTTSSSAKTKTTTSKKVTNKKGVAKKDVKKSTKKATKKHGKKRGGGRRQGPKTNAERIVSSTQSNGEQLNAKIPKTAKDTLRIIPMGGQEEVGRNMVIFEYGKDIVIVDMGMQFPEEDMPGIDYIVPNVSYLKGKEQNIRGVIFTHGHLDHIGAAPVLLKELGYPPVIARDLTLALIKKKLEDGDPGGSDKIRTISVKNIDRKIRLGEFVANFFEVEHSIMDSMGVALVTPVGTPIHLGDWTISHDPVEGKSISYEKLKEFPAPRMLMLESLGVMTKEAKSEKNVQENIETLIKNAEGRIILATFSSQIKRIKLLLQYAQTLGKKVALDGYSMRTNIEIAQQLGYLNVSKNLLIPINDIDKYPDNKVLVLCTGAQGEHNAVLNRIVTDNHRFIKLKKSDTIVFSSSVIPGNERSVQRLKDNLYRKCDNVVHSNIMIHTSGHATQDDIKTMIKYADPQYFIPIYANYFMLKEAAKLAIEDGFSPKRIAILDNGSMIEFSKKGSRIRKEKADASYVFVDGLGVGDIGHVVLRDRQMLSEDGMYVITVLIDSKTKEVVGNMQITSRGFIYVKDNFDLVNETKKKVKAIVKKTTSRDSRMDYRQVENEIRDRIGEYLFQKTQRRPMILPVVIEV